MVDWQMEFLNLGNRIAWNANAYIGGVRHAPAAFPGQADNRHSFCTRYLHSRQHIAGIAGCAQTDKNVSFESERPCQLRECQARIDIVAEGR